MKLFALLIALLTGCAHVDGLEGYVYNDIVDGPDVTQAIEAVSDQIGTELVATVRWVEGPLIYSEDFPEGALGLCSTVYGIFIIKGDDWESTLAHELVHEWQHTTSGLEKSHEGWEWDWTSEITRIIKENM